MAEISSIATENRLPPADEARVRTAAQVAADRMGWSVPRQVLDYIIATSNPKAKPGGAGGARRRHRRICQKSSRSGDAAQR